MNNKKGLQNVMLHDCFGKYNMKLERRSEYEYTRF